MSALADSVQIPTSAFTRLFMEKCVEVDAFALCLRWIENKKDDESTAHFMTAFRTGCLQVFKIALHQQDFQYGSLAFIERWTEYVGQICKSLVVAV